MLRRAGRVTCPVLALRATHLPHSAGAPALSDIEPGRLFHALRAAGIPPLGGMPFNKPMRPAPPPTPPLAASPRQGKR